MQLLKNTLQDIKIGRLIFAIAVTVLIADTLPHPNLSAGLLESSITQVQEAITEMQNSSQLATAESRSNRQ